MRIIKVMVIGAFVAVAAAFGLFVALVAAAAGGIALAVRRWLGGTNLGQQVERFRRPTAPRSPRSEPDVIDVAATEVESMQTSAERGSLR